MGEYEKVTGKLLEEQGAEDLNTKEVDNKEVGGGEIKMSYGLTEEDRYLEYLENSLGTILEYTEGMDRKFESFDYSKDSMCKLETLMEKIIIATGKVKEYKCVPGKYKEIQKEYVIAMTLYNEVATEFPKVMGRMDEGRLAELEAKLHRGTANLAKAIGMISGLRLSNINRS